jgi:nucleotide-binding universal stress UspA family protein
MFRTILVPLDLTERHGPALAAAGALARGGEVVLLHVIEPIPGVPVEDDREFFARLEQKARAHLDRAGAALSAKGANWRSDVRYGARGPAVVEAARDLAADLIVLTAPAAEPGRTPATGSLSYGIGYFAPCAVLLVKPEVGA